MAFRFIICEYNPLHNGHIHHIASTKANPDDKVICIMSGNCVQRGELAVKDKYTRASWAIKAGADMVIELPSRYVLGPAQIFATGAARIIKHFKDNSTLSFGSENGDIDTLTQIAEILDDEELNIELKKNLIRGMSYPKALSGALQSYCVENGLEDFNDVLDSPNNTLGIEYIKALDKLNCKCTPTTIMREDNYNNETISGEYASASAIRANLDNRDILNKYCPSFVANDISKNSEIESKLFSLLKYNLSSLENWKNICGVSEGIENRIIEKLNTSNTYDELVNEIKSKRYTLARIKRLLLNGLISNTYKNEDLLDNDIKYVKILAIKSQSKSLLSMFDIPVVTSSGDYRLNNVEEDPTDIKIDNLYNSICYNYKPKFLVLE